MRSRCHPEILQEAIVQQICLERIKQAQEEEKWIADLKTYPIGDVTKLKAEEIMSSALIAPDYEVDQSEL